MQSRKPEPKPEPPLKVEGGLKAEQPTPRPSRPGGMIGQGGPNRSDRSGRGGMIGES